MNAPTINTKKSFNMVGQKFAFVLFSIDYYKSEKWIRFMSLTISNWSVRLCQYRLINRRTIPRSIALFMDKTLFFFDKALFSSLIGETFPHKAFDFAIENCTDVFCKYCNNNFMLFIFILTLIHLWASAIHV